MRPTFMGFETATRGLMVNQKSLDIVGHNTSNIGVTGYTRQRVDTVSLSVNMRYTRYSVNSTSMAGQGVAAYGVSQLRDPFLDKRFREEHSDAGYYGVTSAVLDDLTSALDEITPSNMSVAMQKFQDSWKELLGKNSEVTGAANLLAVSTQIIQVFRQMSAKVDNVWNQQEYGLKLDIESVNSIVERVAQLNDEISRQQFNSMDVGNELYRPLELLDQRNVLLDELSQFADIQYETDDKGMVTVWLGGKNDGVAPIVSGDKFEKLSLRVNNQGSDFKTVSIFWNSSGEDIRINSGELQATLDMLNGRGLNMNSNRGETYTEGILYFKDKVDQFAKTFVQEFNNVIEIGDAQGRPFDPPRFKPLFAFSEDSREGAANIIINPEWEADATFLIRDVLNKIDGESGKNDNSYAARAYALFDKNMEFGEFTGTISSYISFYSVTKLANNKAFSDSRLETVVDVSETLLNQIQNVSGVSMEEEGVDMMMYKKAYDAVSRVFTTLDEMLDKLINGTGRVGL